MHFSSYNNTRSSTPPLLYARSQSNTFPNGGALTTGLLGRDVSSIQMPNRSSLPQQGPRATGTYTSLGSVNNPFISAGVPLPTPDCGIAYRPSITNTEAMYTTRSTPNSTGLSWATALPPGRESSKLVSLDTEDAALLAEEGALKAKLAELRAEREMYDDEQLHLSQGWAMLLEREERFYTEPVPDFTPEILASEQRCLTTQEQLNHAQSHLESLHQQLTQYDFLIEEKNRLLVDIKTLTSNFKALEQRRKNCLYRAGHFFDVESRRATEAPRAVKVLDTQLRQLRESVPLRSLAQTQEINEMMDRSSAKSVTFAPEKSIVLDWSSTASSMEPEERNGMTSSSIDMSADQMTIGSSRHARGQESICIALEDADNDGITGIGGVSAVMSLNQASQTYVPAMKRTRMEMGAQ